MKNGQDNIWQMVPSKFNFMGISCSIVKGIVAKLILMVKSVKYTVVISRRLGASYVLHEPLPAPASFGHRQSTTPAEQFSSRLVKRDLSSTATAKGGSLEYVRRHQLYSPLTDGICGHQRSLVLDRNCGPRTHHPPP